MPSVLLHRYEGLIACQARELSVQKLYRARVRASDRRHLYDLPFDQLQAYFRRKHARLGHAQVLLHADGVALRVFANDIANFVEGGAHAEVVSPGSLHGF